MKKIITIGICLILSLGGCRTLRPMKDVPAALETRWQLVGGSGIPHTKVVARASDCADNQLFLLSDGSKVYTDGYMLDSDFIDDGTRLLNITFVICAARYPQGQSIPKTSALVGLLVWERRNKRIDAVPITVEVVDDTPKEISMSASMSWAFDKGDQLRFYITSFDGGVKLLTLRADAMFSKRFSN